jgi:hypothetical protein
MAIPPSQAGLCSTFQAKKQSLKDNTITSMKAIKKSFGESITQQA